MMKKIPEDTDIILKTRDTLLEILRDEVKTQIAHEMDIYKSGIMVNDKWCCNNMRKFASKFWHIGEPAKDENGFMMKYSVYRMPVNYCPFCGVKI